MHTHDIIRIRLPYLHVGRASTPRAGTRIFISVLGLIEYMYLKFVDQSDPMAAHGRLLSPLVDAVACANVNTRSRLHDVASSSPDRHLLCMPRSPDMTPRTSTCRVVGPPVRKGGLRWWIMEMLLTPRLILLMSPDVG